MTYLYSAGMDTKYCDQHARLCLSINVS